MHKLLFLRVSAISLPELGTLWCWELCPCTSSFADLNQLPWPAMMASEHLSTHCAGPGHGVLRLRACAPLNTHYVPVCECSGEHNQGVEVWRNRSFASSALIWANIFALPFPSPSRYLLSCYLLLLFSCLVAPSSNPGEQKLQESLWKDTGFQKKMLLLSSS